MTASCSFPIARITGITAGLVAFALAVSPAQGACGDYLHLGTGKVAKQSETQAPLPAPCKCPQCSQGPFQLPFAPPATNTIDSERPAILSIFASVRDDNRVRFGRGPSDR